ncbi:ABC transporter substrate-binding protein [Bradyrhizobium vignae]|uniref:ABC transporter substrate-binding protein n=1 Tax=Bradyrhizobium vignae TaxID=1549949 RepID=UPI00100A2B55|nr:ABC transporter substrate-binding protein [Bradyrhizobium vignae]RXG91891.1 ABC transporter substrate-binding protein [Bradyrhizobium vignae]
MSDVGFGVEALRRGMSRRELTNLLIGSGMSAAAAGTFAISASIAHAQTPRRGGRIKVAHSQSSTAETLDPARAMNSSDNVRLFMFYNGLTRFNEELSTELDLAEEITPSQRATIWNIKLRRDVRFHDGTPLTSADVVYSLRRHKDPAVGSGGRSLVTAIEEITATGPREVRIILSGPNYELPAILSIWHFLVVKDGATDFRTANGTGPYECQEFQPGGRTIAMRNSEYFRPGKPYLDEIEFFGITDESARVNALLAGNVQLINSVSQRSARRIVTAPNLSLFETKCGAYQDLVIRLDQAPGSNPDFVLAVKHLFNREQIARAVYRNFATVANDQPIGPTSPFYDPGLPQRPFDLDKAAFHLQRSGFGNQTFPIVISPAARNSEEIALLLQQSGREIGLNFQLQRVPAEGYWWNYYMKRPIFFSSVPPKATPDIAFTTFFQSRAPWNESAWRNERFDALLLEARAEADTGKRGQVYREMQSLIHDGSGVCIPVFASYLDAHDSDLKGLLPIAVGGMMADSFAEHVWLDQ